MNSPPSFFYQTKSKDLIWPVQAGFSTYFDLAYEAKDLSAQALYQKNKRQQWDSETRLDWNVDLDPENPLSYDDCFLPIFGSDSWNKADHALRAAIRHHYQAYTLSQFLHGEQAALVAAARLVEVLPSIAAKQFAAQQAADEARHVEIFSRLISEKVQLSYEIDDGLQALVNQGLSDSRWDFVVLTTQILIEGLALGSLQNLREFSRNSLISSAAAYIMADEARHVSFGLSQLEPYLGELSDSELKERSEFARTALAALSARLSPQVVWNNLGLKSNGAAGLTVNQGFEKVVGRLFARVEVMLEKLKLRKTSGSKTGSDDCVERAAARLKVWARADERLGQ